MSYVGKKVNSGKIQPIKIKPYAWRFGRTTKNTSKML
jgi:hypothetical protein